MGLVCLWLFSCSCCTCLPPMPPLQGSFLLPLASRQAPPPQRGWFPGTGSPCTPVCRALSAVVPGASLCALRSSLFCGSCGQSAYSGGGGPAAPLPGCSAWEWACLLPGCRQKPLPRSSLHKVKLSKASAKNLPIGSSETAQPTVARPLREAKEPSYVGPRATGPAPRSRAERALDVGDKKQEQRRGNPHLTVYNARCYALLNLML